MSDVATALSESLTRDGQTLPTANLPMAGFKHTGVGNATDRNQYAAAGQVQDNSLTWCGTAGGTANAITFSPNPPITAYVVGQSFTFQAGASANTGATTIAISGLTAIDLQVNGVACSGGEIQPDQFYEVFIDTTSTAQLRDVSKSVDSGASIISIGASVASNILTCTLNPVSLDFRSATLGSGTVNTRVVPSAITVAVPSTATLGTQDGVLARLILIAIDNSGTVELAIANWTSPVALDESSLISTTTISTAADSANVFYSTTGRSNVPYRVVGFVEVTQVTAGTWVAPSTIQGAGGEALAYIGSAKPTSKIQPITASVASNALTLTLNPTVLDFRSATLTSGAVNTRTISNAISIVVSNGSTLGTINTVPSRLAVLAIDNAGTVEVAVVNTAGSFGFDESTLISTTAEGGAGGADSKDIAYSTTARSNVPFRLVGFVDLTQAIAGTWVTSPSTIQGYGGNSSANKAGGITRATAVASTSGTAIDFTGIPSWVKRITVMFSNVSTNGTSTPIIQIGSGSLETTGYASSGAGVNSSASVAALSSVGFILGGNSTAAYARHGMAILSEISTNTWVCSGTLGRSDAAQVEYFGGSKSTTNVIDRLRVTTAGGDNFDSGLINILYE